MRSGERYGKEHRVHLGQASEVTLGPGAELTVTGTHWRIWYRAALLGVAAVGAAHTTTAAFAPNDEGWQGLSEIQRLAFEEHSPERIHVLSHLDYGQLQPEDGLLIVHPTVKLNFPKLAGFLSAGGRAAIADDHGRSDTLLNRFGLRRGPAPTHPRWTVGGNRELAIATPATSAQASAARHPILRGVEHVATNHTSTLVPDADIELTELLRFDNEGGTRHLFAATGVIGDTRACGALATPEGTDKCGRLVAIADASVFINLMMRYVGNRRFAKGMIRYLLQRGDKNRRRGNLYIVTGEFSQTGSVDGAEGLGAQVDDAIGRAVAELESLRSNGMSSSWVLALALLVSLGVVVWSVQIVGQSREVVLPEFAKPIPLELQGGFAGRYANLATLSEDRAMLVLELQRTFEAALKLRFGLDESASREEVYSTLRAAGVLDALGAKKLAKLFERLAAGERAILSGHKLTLSNRSLSGMTNEIVAVLSSMDSRKTAGLK